MAGPNTPYTNLDFSQVLRQSFDESTDRLRVDAIVNATIGDITIDAAESDIAIKDRNSGYFLKVNSDGSIDTNTIISAGSGDSIQSWLYDSNGTGITLGQKTSANSIPVVLSSDQSISTSIDSTVGTIESGIVDIAYNEVLSVASASLTTISTYTAIQTSRLKIVEVSGTNIAEYTIEVNGTPIHKKRTYFGYLDNKFEFSKGYNLANTDVVTVKALHNQASVGDFSAFILVLKD